MHAMMKEIFELRNERERQSYTRKLFSIFIRCFGRQWKISENAEQMRRQEAETRKAAFN